MFSVLSFTRPGRPTPALSFYICTPFGAVDATTMDPVQIAVGSPQFAAKAGAPGVSVVGVLSFDGSSAALAQVIGLTRTPGSAAPQLESRPIHWPTLTSSAVLRPSPEGYCEGVRIVLRAIEENQVVKAVLGRTVEYRFDGPVPVAPLTRALARRHPEARIYCCPLPGGDTFVGASPELLVARHGMALYSHPLAGSAPRSANPTDDEAAARQLLGSDKDRREHGVVIEMIADTLAPYCSQLTVPDEPALVATHTVWHLGTWISGKLRDPGTTSLQLAAALQPTPALCGTPQAAAYDLLARVEPFDREWFGGAVGWNDERGDGEWTVAIRCARLSGSTATLFAGAGLVEGSDPDAELLETDAKLAALQDVLLGVTEPTHQARIA